VSAHAPGPRLKVGDTVSLVQRVASVYGFEARDQFCVVEMDKTHAVVRAHDDNAAAHFLANVAGRRVGDTGSRWVFPRKALRAAIAKARGR
jgi:hypothetical protein